MSAHRRRVGAAVAVSLLALTGCGVPTGGEVEMIEPAALPSGLIDPATPTPAPSELPSQTPLETAGPGEPGIYLVDGETSLLVQFPREVRALSTEGMLNAILQALAAGPTPEELASGITTNIPPRMTIAVTDLSGDLVTIDLTADQLPSSGQGTSAVAQIVLSATTVPGVNRVMLSVDGAVVVAPLTEGQVTDQPLTEEDYQSLIAPPGE